MNSEILMAYCTFPDLECAERICKELLEAKLIACANIQSPQVAIYRWKDSTQRESEVSTWFKTSTLKKDALKTRFKELHPYDVPCLVFTPIIDSLPDYKAWVLKETE